MIGSVRRQFFKGVYDLAVRLRGENSVFTRLRYLQALQHEPTFRVVEKQRTALARQLITKIPVIPKYRQLLDLVVGLTADNVVERLQQFPILEKEELQQWPEQLTAQDWNSRYFRKTTGGSTGQPVTVFKNPEAIAQEMAATWLAYGWFGIGVGDPCVRFWGRPAGNLKRRFRYLAADIATHRVTLSAFGYSTSDMQRYMRTIRRFRPVYLYGYVSAIEDLARHVLTQRASVDGLSLRAVVTTSEVLTVPQRQTIENAFVAPVQNEYGAGEVGPIAYECPAGSLHLIPTNQFVEILRENGEAADVGEPGSVVITDLTNEVMPLIRYRLGDTASLGGTCSCGRSFPVLNNVFGRAYDFVEAPDGRRYHGEFFMYLFEDLRAHYPTIGQFQVIQTAPDSLLVRLRTKDQRTYVADAVKDALRKRLPSIGVQVEFAERLERRPSGKMLVVENRLRSSAQSFS